MAAEDAALRWIVSSMQEKALETVLTAEQLQAKVVAMVEEQDFFGKVRRAHFRGSVHV